MSFKRIVEKETKQKNDNYLDLTIFKMLPMKKFSKTTNQRKKKIPNSRISIDWLDIGSIHIITKIYNKKL